LNVTFSQLESLNFFWQLPDTFKDFAAEHMDGKQPSSRFMAHCRREVFHAQWDILLDEEFLEAYQHGIVVKCCYEIIRRFYPRLITYSADYKEKYVHYFLCPRTFFLNQTIGSLLPASAT